MSIHLWMNEENTGSHSLGWYVEEMEQILRREENNEKIFKHGNKKMILLEKSMVRPTMKYLIR